MSIKSFSTTSATEPIQQEPIITPAAELSKLAKHGVFYVSQDNYVFTYTQSGVKLRLYADSATSCIIVILRGTRDHRIGIAHLSRTARFDDFFDMAAVVFKEEPTVYVYASGANPMEPIPISDGIDYTAFRNTNTIRNWISTHAFIPGDNNELPPPPRIYGNMIQVGLGNPSVYSNSFDCFGIALSGHEVSATRDRETLTLQDRDPTGGLQTLFCMFGDQASVRAQVSAFSALEKQVLVALARNKNFGKAAYMTDEQILNTYSSTPAFEVPWFCDTIREAAKYVNAHKD
jgi:hypothetical protein